MIVQTGSEESKLPDFLIVGAARSATTSLFYYLKNYDEIYMPARKEPWFFSYAGNPPDYSSPGAYDVVSKLDDYAALFKAARPDQIIGEASPSYLFTYSAVIRNIKDVYGGLYDKLRIIIILRNPAERAYSHFMLHKRGYKEPLDFRKAIEPDTITARRRDNWDIFYDYTGCGLYYEQVKAYMEEFPHVKVLLYEDLVQDPRKTLTDICEFLSVDYREDVKLERLNKSGVPKFELLNEIINKSSLLKDFLMAVIPVSVRKRMKHRAYMVNMKPVGMSEEYREYLRPFYVKDVENLSALLKRDLSVWLEPGR
ncbi:MAG TPA: sulfotransferase [Thermodesulfobacteriota bacterium]|nr:sulfotransferase [Thermodesulfobacteriota bacterium]